MIDHTNNYSLNFDGHVITTERLELHPVHVKDIEDLWLLVSDARITDFLAWEPHQCKFETEAMVKSLIAANQSGKAFHWAIRSAGHVIGLISFIDIRRTHRSWTLNRAELAYWIGADNQGNGYATEASFAIMQHGFCKLNLHKIIVYHADGNVFSSRVINKVGFKFIGTEREAFCKKDCWHDLKYYEILKSDFENLKNKHYERLQSILQRKKY